MILAWIMQFRYSCCGSPGLESMTFSEFSRMLHGAATSLSRQFPIGEAVVGSHRKMEQVGAGIYEIVLLARENSWGESLGADLI